MPNQPLPYGNIFAVNTPHLDRLTDRLYAQQQQLDNRRYQQMQSLDDEFKRSVANIRTADIPEFTKAYEDYKNSKINLLRGHKMGNIDYMKAQQDANEKLAKAYSLLNESASEKAWEKDLGTKIHSNWKQYNDDATDLLKARMSIPVNQLPTAVTKDKTGKDVSLYGDDAFRYKGNFSFSKDLKDAFGTTPKDLGTLDETTDPNALERTMTKYKGYNNPYQAYQILANAMADPRKADEFIRTHTFNPIQEQQIEDRFNKILSNPATQKVYGLTGNEDFVGDDTELGHTIKMAVMLGTTEPTKEPVFKTNLANKTEAANREWDRRNRLTFGQHMALIGANKAAGVPSPDTGYLSDEVANNVGENITLTKGGKQFDQKVIYSDKIDPVRLNIINGNGEVQPIPIKQLDGSVRYGYYQDQNTGDWKGDEGKTISRERVKDDYIKIVSPSKFKTEAGTKGSENTKDQLIKNPLKQKTSYKLGNKTFSADQVQKAAKASGMSVADYIKQAGLQ